MTDTMHAMVLHAPRTRLHFETRQAPSPSAGEILVRISACAVCRTDLHIVDGEMTDPRLPLIPGHEIVGTVQARGPGVTAFAIGERVGIPWLGGTCQTCEYCRNGRENLCDRPSFTGYSNDGGFASHAIANVDFAFRVPGNMNDQAAAPLLCAGLIGWRSLRKVGDGRRLGLYGFGAAAHIIAQVARAQGREVYAFTRPGDTPAQLLAEELGCVWAGGSDEAPPASLDAAIIFAPVGALVPAALRGLKKGGRVVCGGIHMSDIPQFPYRLLWGEREICSVANLTRKDAHEFLDLATQIPLQVKTTTYPLSMANEALEDLRRGQLSGAAVLIP